MAQEEPVTGREKAVPCQHCYAKIFHLRGTVDWWVSRPGETRSCDTAATGLKHKPMPQITVG